MSSAENFTQSAKREGTVGRPIEDVRRRKGSQPTSECRPNMEADLSLHCSHNP